MWITVGELIAELSKPGVDPKSNVKFQVGINQNNVPIIFNVVNRVDHYGHEVVVVVEKGF